MYDLILRDATIVTSSGRQVADVAVKGGRIAYVGPRPPRRARDEISAIGKFLMPGVIDMAVQLPEARDDVLTETRAALSGGVTSVVALPAGSDPVVGAASARRRREQLGTTFVDVGLWGTLSADGPRVLAPALSEGVVLGALAYLDAGDHQVAASVLAAALEQDGLVSAVLDPDDLGPVEPVLDRARAAQRHVHLLHVSTSAETQLLDPVRGAPPYTSGVTPHHLFLSTDGEPPFDAAARPPVRLEQERRALWTAIKRGRIDAVASDHHASGTGLPGTELLFPLMLSAVRYGRLSLERLVSLCAEAPARILGLSGKGRIERGADADLLLFSEGEVTRVRARTLASGAGWSPYLDREVAPKPDLVMRAGAVVVREGQLLADEPTGGLL